LLYENNFLINFFQNKGGCCDCDHMVVGFTTIYAISAYHHWCCEFESRSGRGVQHYVIKFVVCLIVFNATFNNISVISWRSVLLVEETGGPGENHRPVAIHWQTSALEPTTWTITPPRRLSKICNVYKNNVHLLRVS
jgi:hypothetical protein